MQKIFTFSLAALLSPIGVGQSSLAARASAQATWPSNIKPDLTVAQDGSGNFPSVQAAIDSIPKGNTERRIIFIRFGSDTPKLASAWLV